MKKLWPFLLLLGLYAAVIVVAGTDHLQDDEGTYLTFAENLSRGFYSPSDPYQLNLWSGPGYPLVLVPAVAAGAPLLIPKLLNAVLLVGAVLFCYGAMRLYVSRKTAFWAAMALGLYPPFLRYIHLLMSETFAVFLISGFIYCLCRLHRGGKPFVFAALAAVFMAWLAMTKVLFGYVLVAAIVLALFGLVSRRASYRKALLVYIFALIGCLPYLLYTYHLTGKFFYWGDAGGSSLYWMSSPYEGELGDWQQWKRFAPGSQLEQNHGDFFRRLAPLGSVERDAALKREAIRNIVDRPGKFLKNWAANVGRLVLSYPYSFTPQKVSTYFYLLPNMFLVAAVVGCLYPTWKSWGAVPGEIRLLLVLEAVAFAGSSLLSAYSRHFLPLVPILVVWVAFVLDRIVRVELRRPAAKRGESRVGVTA